MPELNLGREARRVADQVTHWTPARWCLRTRFGTTRADEMQRFVQHLADVAAEHEGEPQRTVPRLSNDMALPIQLHVIADDLPDLHVDVAGAQLRRVRDALFDS